MSDGIPGDDMAETSARGSRVGVDDDVRPPPRGWHDKYKLPHAYVKDTTKGPKYLCKHCGEINDCRGPSYHKPGCPAAALVPGQ